MKQLKDIIKELQDTDKFKTTNGQDFYSAPYDRPWNFGNYKAFKIGTMHGLWKWTNEGFEILAFLNNHPGSGHLEDVFDWFSCSSLLAQVPLFIRSVDNKRFLKHLLEKRGFVQINDAPDVQKALKDIEKDVRIKVENKIYIKS